MENQDVSAIAQQVVEAQGHGQAGGEAAAVGSPCARAGAVRVFGAPLDARAEGGEVLLDDPLRLVLRQCREGVGDLRRQPQLKTGLLDASAYLTRMRIGTADFRAARTMPIRSQTSIVRGRTPTALTYGSRAGGLSLIRQAAPCRRSSAAARPARPVPRLRPAHLCPPPASPAESPLTISDFTAAGPISARCRYAEERSPSAAGGTSLCLPFPAPCPGPAAVERPSPARRIHGVPVGAPVSASGGVTDVDGAPLPRRTSA